jgi:hypothetical protein
MEVHMHHSWVRCVFTKSKVGAYSPTDLIVLILLRLLLLDQIGV